jgi:hypothetical protein
MTPAQTIAKVLCGGFPDVCKTHVDETLAILLLIPELLVDNEVVRAAAKANHPDLVSKHPADQVIIMSDMLSALTAAGRKICEEVPTP